jgi:hypothetical protein
MLCVESSPCNTITGQPVTLELITEENVIVAVRHAIDVFDDEGFWQHNPQHPIKLTIEEIYRISRFPATTLSKTLARIASNHEVGRREASKLGDVPFLNYWT